jgi:hypothetical protein
VGDGDLKESSAAARNEAANRFFSVQADKLMMKGRQLYALSNIVGHKDQDLKMTQRCAKLSPHSERDRMDSIWIR